MPLARARDRVFLARALVVVRRAGGRVGVEVAAEVGGGVVAADGLAGPLRRGDLREHLRVARDDARKVHHLPEADDVRPRHRLGDIPGSDFHPGGLEARRGRGA